MHSFLDIVAQVFRSITANKLRSFLTMFGIAWGVASLLLLIGLGEGFRSGQKRSLSTIGSDIIFLDAGIIPALPGQHNGGRPYKITLSDCDALRARAPHVRDVTGLLIRGDLKQTSEYTSFAGAVWGVESNVQKIRTIPLAQGRYLSDADIADHRHVVVLGQKVNEMLFMGHPSMGAFITINGLRFQVVGVAAKGGRGNNTYENQKLYIPITTALDNFALVGKNIPHDSLSGIDYQPTTPDLNETAKAEVHQIVAERHGFDPTATEAFQEWDTIKAQRTVGVIFTAMDLFLGAVGIVTLALGAVGIINIMLVTVTERTKEIGLCKALGATHRNILLQFFMEGLLLTGLSGLIGIAGASVLMIVLGKALGNNDMGFDPPRLVPWSAAMALGTLTVCGVVAGIYPARKAALLEPVEALRKE